MRRVVVALVALAVGLSSASTALATFISSAASGPMAISSATLSPPTSVAAAQVNCQNNKPPVVSVSWTGSSSGFTTGYTVLRASTSAGPYTTIGSVSSGSSSFTDPSTTLAYGTAYYYVVDATVNSWTAGSSVAAATTLNRACH